MVKEYDFISSSVDQITWCCFNTQLAAVIVRECFVVKQLQGFLDDTDFLDPFPSSFRTGYAGDIALVTLVDDLRRGVHLSRPS